MSEIVQAEEIIRIANNSLKVDTGTDWTAIIALGFSILSTIFILLWQNYLRKQDKKEQLKRIEKEDKVRQWNALYPHRLNFYTEFYDTLFQFVEYKGKQSLTPDASLMDNVLIDLDDIDIFLKKFNKFTEEAKVLFDKKVQKEVRSVYCLVKEFVENPYSFNNEDSYSSLLDGAHIQHQLRENLYQVQNNVRDLKLNDVLRHRFEQILTVESNENE